jgi:hypothetical protein
VWARPLDCRLRCRVTKPGRYAAGAGCHSVRREDVKRLEDLERENATLKPFLADAEVEKVALKAIANGNI